MKNEYLDIFIQRANKISTQYIVLFFCFYAISTYSQQNECPNFYNFDLSEGSRSLFFSPFGQLNNAYNTQPWYTSHGSPQLRSGGQSIEGLHLGSINRDGDQFCEGVVNGAPVTAYYDLCGDWGSEGVFYDNYTFKKGHIYTISFEAVSDGIDYTYIMLADNYFTPSYLNDFNAPLVADNTLEIEQFRQDFDQMQAIWIAEDYSDDGSTMHEITFIPNKDYNQLWISMYDPHGYYDNFNEWYTTRTLIIKSLSIQGGCKDCEENGGNIVSNPIPEVLLKDNVTINAINSNLFTSIGQNSNIQARKSIVMSASGNNSFTATKGSTFHAQIKECDLCEGEDVCEIYDEDDFNFIYIPDVFTPCAVNPLNRIFKISHGYPIAYNAYYGEFRVFDRFGEMVHEQIFNDLECGPDKIVLEWDGYFAGQQSAADVYVYTLKLVNCDNSETFVGDVTLIESNCSNIQEPIISSSRSVNLEFDKTSTTIFPNPTEDVANIKLVDYHGYYENLTVEIYDLQGRKITFDGLAESQVHMHSINLSRELAGVYYVLILGDDKVIDVKKLVKL